MYWDLRLQNMNLEWGHISAHCPLLPGAPQHQGLPFIFTGLSKPPVLNSFQYDLPHWDWRFTAPGLPSTLLKIKHMGSELLKNNVSCQPRLLFRPEGFPYPLLVSHPISRAFSLTRVIIIKWLEHGCLKVLIHRSKEYECKCIFKAHYSYCWV